MPRPEITNPNVALYGNMSIRPCKLCGINNTRFGTLIDPNGHKWLICVGCIDNLWSGNAAIITEEQIEQRAAQLLQDKILGSGDNV